MGAGSTSPGNGVANASLAGRGRDLPAAEAMGDAATLQGQTVAFGGFLVSAAVPCPRLRCTPGTLDVRIARASRLGIRDRFRMPGLEAGRGRLLRSRLRRRGPDTRRAGRTGHDPARFIARRQAGGPWAVAVGTDLLSLVLADGRRAGGIGRPERGLTEARSAWRCRSATEGPHAGSFFATAESARAQAPGRDYRRVGRCAGNTAYAWALQTREQHIPGAKEGDVQKSARRAGAAREHRGPSTPCTTGQGAERIRDERVHCVRRKVLRTRARVCWVFQGGWTASTLTTRRGRGTGGAPVGGEIMKAALARASNLGYRNRPNSISVAARTRPVDAATARIRRCLCGRRRKAARGGSICRRWMDKALRFPDAIRRSSTFLNAPGLQTSYHSETEMMRLHPGLERKGRRPRTRR